MPGPGEDFEDQDRAETLDETNYTEEAGEFRTFEELPDVFDVTSRVGDDDDDEALALDADEFDEDSIDPDQLEDDDETLEFLSVDENDLTDEDQVFDEDVIDEDDTIDGLDQVGDAEQVTGGADPFTRFQSKGVNDEDLQRMGYARREDQD